MRRKHMLKIAGTTEYFYKIQNSGNSEHKHFEFNLAFDYILVIIRNDVSYTVACYHCYVTSVIPDDD